MRQRKRVSSLDKGIVIETPPLQFMSQCIIVKTLERELNKLMLLIISQDKVYYYNKTWKRMQRKSCEEFFLVTNTASLWIIDKAALNYLHKKWGEHKTTFCFVLFLIFFKQIRHWLTDNQSNCDVYCVAFHIKTDQWFTKKWNRN